MNWSIILKLISALFELIAKKRKEKKRNEIKSDPLNYFDSEFGGVHNDKELHQADYKQNPTREITHSER